LSRVVEAKLRDGGEAIPGVFSEMDLERLTGTPHRYGTFNHSEVGEARL